MIPIALIISLNFRAAHVSHLVASYKQMTELGFEAYCLVHPEALSYFPPDIKCITSIKGLNSIAVSIFWFPSLKNIVMMLKLKLFHGSKILYVFHEPIERFSSYLKSGNSYWWTVRFFMKYYVGLIFLWLSDRILLPSQKAVNLYRKGASHIANPNFDYLPLMYDDERSEINQHQKRKYISYIGGISKDHAFNEFVDYIYQLFKNHPEKSYSFLIASWREGPKDARIEELLGRGLLTLHTGRPMSNEEINSFYASTLLVWNAYNRSTQSGVLAKAFMFGTPAIVMRKNLSEFIRENREVVAINDNTDQEELGNVTDELLSKFDEFSQEARLNFERNYYYKIHNEKMRSILASIGL